MVALSLSNIPPVVSVTLKYGVERLIRERIPEIGQILDTTDHASGENPFYAPAAK